MQHPDLEGYGRCRICDMPYRTFRADDVAEHRRYHGRHIAACKGAGAPAPERTRDDWRTNGLAIQDDMSVPFEERLAGAERWLVADYHEHLVSFLRFGGRRLDLREYFTRRVEGRSRLSNFAPDVAMELRLRYSDNFIA